VVPLRRRHLLRLGRVYGVVDLPVHSDVKAVRMSREDLAKLGYKPGDGKGGIVRAGTLAEMLFCTESKPTIRVPSRSLNGVEKRWFEVLRGRHPNAVIQPQFRVRVSAFDAPTVTHYTADFAVWRPSGDDAWICVLWECKDARRRPHSDELTRPKMARQNNPWISQIWLATWDGVTWKERILA
jgi:hypothetical protein